MRARSRKRRLRTRGGTYGCHSVVRQLGGQGVYCEVESEGHAENCRVGQRWGKVEPALRRRRRFSSTHRTKVCADCTAGKIIT
jgi:hypothetical protein